MAAAHVCTATPHDQYLFMTGDQQRWMVVNRDEMLGCNKDATNFVPRTGPLCVARSSSHCGPHTTEASVTDNPGGFWLSLTDTLPGSECAMPRVASSSAYVPAACPRPRLYRSHPLLSRLS